MYVIVATFRSECILLSKHRPTPCNRSTRMVDIYTRPFSVHLSQKRRETRYEEFGPRTSLPGQAIRRSVSTLLTVRIALKSRLWTDDVHRRFYYTSANPHLLLNLDLTHRPHLHPVPMLFIFQSHSFIKYFVVCDNAAPTSFHPTTPRRGVVQAM